MRNFACCAVCSKGFLSIRLCVNHPLATSSDNPVWNGTYVIKNTGSSGPFDYVGKRIELFTEHYREVINRSGEPSDYYLGWVPEILIPFAAPEGLGGAPFDIAANNNQAVWIDIYIPRDALPGIDRGNLKVSVNSVVTNTIPIALEVYDFTLPDETHLKNMFVSGTPIAERHGVSYGSAEYYRIEAKYHQMAHRHRFDIVRSVKNLTVLERYHKRYLTGELYTPACGYEGPGENVGNGTFSVGPYNYRPEEFSPDNEAGWRAGSDAWVNWFNANAPDVEIHKYLRDEPYTASEPNAVIAEIIKRCEWIHNNPGPGSALMTYDTIWIVPELQGHIDFWSMVAYHLDLSDVASEQSQGKKCAFYNGYRPCSGSVVVDADAIEFRVMPWICWKYNVDQYFLWRCDKWRNIDIFVEHGSPHYKVGDGTFFFPGEDKLYPKQDRGLAGPFSGIRMKNWRRGQQDYEYLWLAKQLGFEDEITTIVNNCVPTALSEADRGQNISWSAHGYGFEQYRRQLAELILLCMRNKCPDKLRKEIK